MRTVKFDQEELPIIKEIIALGNSEYENDFPEISKIILEKINIGIYSFSKKELQVLKSYSSNWLNKNNKLINELIDRYLQTPNVDCVNVPEFEKEKMFKTSLVFSIKSKLFLESYISFNEVLERIKTMDQ